MHSREASESGFRRALITLDGSIAAEAILPAFLRMARPLGMEVVLVRVVVPPAGRAPSEDTLDALENTARMLELKKQKADEYLRAIAATPALAGLRVLTTVRTGEAPREIIAAARELQADVIAMSTHGRTGLRRLLFGSVAEAVVRAAHVPVFVLREAHLQAALFDPVSSSGSTVPRWTWSCSLSSIVDLPCKSYAANLTYIPPPGGLPALRVKCCRSRSRLTGRRS